MKKTDNSALSKVIANQEAIAQDQAAADKLRALIAEKKAAIEAAESALPRLDSMTKAREDLLAAVAMGEAKAGDIKKFDDERAVERAAYESARESFLRFEDEVMQMISGLQRKLDEIEARLAEQQAARDGLLRAMFSESAEQAAAEYLEAARKVDQLYVRLLGLDRLSAQKGVGIGIVRFNQELSIPSFALPGIGGNRETPGLGALFDSWGVTYGTVVADTAGEVAREFIDAGVQF